MFIPQISTLKSGENKVSLNVNGLLPEALFMSDIEVQHKIGSECLPTHSCGVRSKLLFLNGADNLIVSVRLHALNMY